VTVANANAAAAAPPATADAVDGGNAVDVDARLDLVDRRIDHLLRRSAEEQLEEEIKKVSERLSATHRVDRGGGGHTECGKAEGQAEIRYVPAKEDGLLWQQPQLQDSHSSHDEHGRQNVDMTLPEEIDKEEGEEREIEEELSTDIEDSLSPSDQGWQHQDPIQDQYQGWPAMARLTGEKSFSGFLTDSTRLEEASLCGGQLSKFISVSTAAAVASEDLEGDDQVAVDLGNGGGGVRHSMALDSTSRFVEMTRIDELFGS